MEPSNATVVRFVALYNNGFEFQFSHLILGYGYMGSGGLAHDILAALYALKKEPQYKCGCVYAGYLCLVPQADGNGTTIGVHSGGSMTLNIQDDSQKNARLLEDIDSFKRLKSAALALMPLIMQGKISHTMLAQQ